MIQKYRISRPYHLNQLHVIMIVIISVEVDFNRLSYLHTRME
jgi:hypothetical protein